MHLGVTLYHGRLKRVRKEGRKGGKREEGREKGRDSGMDGQTELVSRQTEERKKQPRVAAHACHSSPPEGRG